MSISLPNGTLLATPAQQVQYTAAVTRILHLSNFNPELKTRDIQALFKDYEADKGGFRIKWVDDVNVLVVFADAGVAKRAYLTFLLVRPRNFPHPARITPYDKPDAAQIIQTLSARAMGHRSSMSNFGQVAPMAGGMGAPLIPGPGAGAGAGVDGLPNAHHRTGSVSGLGLGNNGNARAGGSGAGWTFPRGAGGSGSMSIPGPPQGVGSGMGSGAGVGSNTIGGSAPGSGSAPTIGGLGGRHGRTGSSSSISLSRQPLAGLGGALNFAQGPMASVGAGSGSGSGSGVGSGIAGTATAGRLPTHTESLDSPAIPAGFSTGKGEGVGGGHSRRLTGRHGAGMQGPAPSGGGAAGAGAGAGLGFGVTRTVSGNSASGRSASSRSSDNEPIVVMDHAPTPELAHGGQLPGRGVAGAAGAGGNGSGSGNGGRSKVPFGQWKMPSSTSPSPSGGSRHSNNGLPPPPMAGNENARRDSHSADKALREVQKALLASVEAQG